MRDKIRTGPSQSVLHAVHCVWGQVRRGCELARAQQTPVLTHTQAAVSVVPPHRCTSNVDSPVESAFVRMARRWLKSHVTCHVIALSDQALLGSCPQPMVLHVYRYGWNSPVTLKSMCSWHRFRMPQRLYSQHSICVTKCLAKNVMAYSES